MKTNVVLRMILLSLLLSFLLAGTYAQSNASDNTGKPTVAVLTIDTRGIMNFSPESMGNLMRMELEKLNIFEVMDRYDVAYKAEKNKVNLSNCYGKICLVETGNLLNADKMLSGSVESYVDNIIVTIRLIDVRTATVEKTQVNEFLDLPQEIKPMIDIALRSMFGLENDAILVKRLSKPYTYESSTTNPGTDRLNLAGPRMGVTFLTGNYGRRITDSKETGGFNAFPVMSQFGYQFETQYLNEGNFQALVEFIPMITGLDQGFFIPSFTLLNGFRNNQTGLEFAFGPTIRFARFADGYFENGIWHLERDWEQMHGPDEENPYPVFERPDYRGDPKLLSGFVFAVGKTFKSGSLNIPVNCFAVPGKDGWRFGASFGFNGKNGKI